MRVYQDEIIASMCKVVTKDQTITSVQGREAPEWMLNMPQEDFERLVQNKLEEITGCSEEEKSKLAELLYEYADIFTCRLKVPG